jgi:hypothetical protein
MKRSDGTSSKQLVYDYRLRQWSTFEYPDRLGRAYSHVSATEHNGRWYFASNNGDVSLEHVGDDSGAHTDGSFGITSKAETAWIKLSGVSGYQRVYSVMLTAEKFFDHTVNLDVMTDYSVLVNTGRSWNEAEMASMSSSRPLQLEVRPSTQKCEAIKVRITQYGNSASGDGDTARIFGLAIKAGMKSGMFKLSQSQRK